MIRDNHCQLIWVTWSNLKLRWVKKGWKKYFFGKGKLELCKIIQSNPRQSEVTWQSNSKQFQTTVGNSEQFEVTPRNETNAQFSRKKSEKSLKNFFGKKFGNVLFENSEFVSLRGVTSNCSELPTVAWNCFELLCKVTSDCLGLLWIILHNSSFPFPKKYFFHPFFYPKLLHVTQINWQWLSRITSCYFM